MAGGALGLGVALGSWVAPEFEVGVKVGVQLGAEAGLSSLA